MDGRETQRTIDLYDIYLADAIVDSQSTEDQIIHHQNAYDHWRNSDRDMASSHRNSLRKLGVDV